MPPSPRRRTEAGPGGRLSASRPLPRAEPGLNVLFRARGIREVPPDVAIVSLSPVPGQITRWPATPVRTPRSVHALLIEALARRGAAVIAFDITFLKPGKAEQDRMLAEAIRRAGNVVLCEYLRSVYVPIPGRDGDGELGVNIEKRLQKIDPMTPRMDVRAQPKRVWCGISGTC